MALRQGLKRRYCIGTVMSRQQLVQYVTFAASLSALAFGILVSRELLIVPALIFTALTAVSSSSAHRGGAAFKNWLCAIILLVLAVNIMGELRTFDRYTDAEWLDFIIAAPSMVAAAHAVVLSAVAYAGVRLDRVLFAIFSVFASLALSATYTYTFAICRYPFDPSVMMIANHYLNSVFATTFMSTVITAVAVYFWLVHKKIKLLYPRHVTDVVGGKGGA